MGSEVTEHVVPSDRRAHLLVIRMVMYVYSGYPGAPTRWVRNINLIIIQCRLVLLVCAPARY